MSHAWRALLEMIDRVRDDLPVELTHRPMFGGAMLYADGRPMASLSDVGLAIKLPPKRQAELLAEPGTTRLRYQPKAPPSRSYIVLSEIITADDEQLLHWLRVAAQHAASAPQPRTRARS